MDVARSQRLSAVRGPLARHGLTSFLGHIAGCRPDRGTLGVNRLLARSRCAVVSLAALQRRHACMGAARASRRNRVTRYHLGLARGIAEGLALLRVVAVAVDVGASDP